MILVIDNYDSFTYNLVQYLGELGADPVVRRNDAIGVDEIGDAGAVGDRAVAGAVHAAQKPASPWRSFAAGAASIPTLGVCLGHQAIGEAYGGVVVRADRVMHGKTSQVDHDGTGVFAGLPSPLEVMRYHSLIVERESLPDCPRDRRRRAGRSDRDPWRQTPRASGVWRAVPPGVRDDAARKALLQNFLDLAR